MGECHRVVEGQETVGSQHQVGGEACGVCLFQSDFGRAHAVGLSRTNTDSMVVFHHCYSVGFHVLHNSPAKIQLMHLFLGGLHFRHAHIRFQRLHLRVEMLCQQTTIHAHILHYRLVRLSHIHLHHAEVFLGGKNLHGLGSERRGDDDFQEDGFHAEGNLFRERTVDGHDAAVDAHLISLIGSLPCFLNGFAHSSTTRIHVLQRHAEGFIEVAHHIQGSVGILYIIV